MWPVAEEGVHEVRTGQWVNTVAHARGIGKWRERVWDHDDNRELKAKRDPYVLAPDDRLVLPTDPPKHLDAATEVRHRYRVRRTPDVLRVRLLKADFNPITKESKAPKTCAYVICGLMNANVTGSTEIDGRGMVTIPLPFGAQRAELTFHEDRGCGMVTKHRVSCQIGHLRPTGTDLPKKVTVQAVQQRLHALGYAPGDQDGEISPRTRAAIRSFATDTRDDDKGPRLGSEPIPAEDAVNGPKVWGSLKKAYGA